jgi:uncharacterized phage protein gp47/JayE
MPYGYDPVLGFQKKPYADILEDMRASVRAEVSPDLVLDSEDPVGQVLMTAADGIAEAWEVAQTGADALDPDNAEGPTLSGTSALTGTVRLSATKSRAPTNCVLTAGTVLTAGVARWHPPGKPSSLFAIVSTFTAPANGTYLLDFEAVDFGPVEAFAGAVTIAPAVSGWSSASLPSDAVRGANEETDAALRVRRAEDLARTGSANVDAIREDVDAVIQATYPDGSCYVLENTAETVVDGMAPKSIEVVVWDGPIPQLANSVLATVIFETKGAGIGTNGPISQSVLDKNGDPHTILFRRATQRAIHFAINVTYDPTILTTSEQVTGAQNAIKAAIVATGLARRKAGLDVIRAPYFKAIREVAGIVDITRYSVAIGAAPGPAESVLPIVIPRREIAIVDSANVVVTMIGASEL